MKEKKIQTLLFVLSACVCKETAIKCNCLHRMRQTISKRQDVFIYSSLSKRQGVQCCCVMCTKYRGFYSCSVLCVCVFSSFFLSQNYTRPHLAYIDLSYTFYFKPTTTERSTAATCDSMNEWMDENEFVAGHNMDVISIRARKLTTVSVYSINLWSLNKWSLLWIN